MQQEFNKLVNTRQSCRSFNDKPLSAEVVQEIAEQALLCPSACNSQPWRLVLATEQQSVKKVASALQGGGHNPFLDKAKAFICPIETCATLRADAKEFFSDNHFVKYDIGQMIAYITLTAESMGVKSCIIGWVNQEQMKEAINMQAGEICNVVVALGYSDIPVRQKVRKDKATTITKI